MFNLSSYLEKFKNLKDRNSDKTILKRIILEETGVNVLEKNINLFKEKIYINGSSIQKNIIFLKKQELLKKIKEALPDSLIKDIS
jgi:hypothetical protein